MPEQERRAIQQQFEVRLDTIDDAIADLTHDVNDMKPALLQIAAAMTTLARMEERYANQQEALVSVNERLNNHGNRLTEAEKIISANTVSAKWTFWFVTALAGGVGELALHMALERMQ